MQSEKPAVIYVDDEEINLYIFKEMFRNDFDIHTTTSAEEALAYLTNNKVDLIVTDQIMPEMSGVEFLEKLITQYSSESEIPRRIMVSGFTQKGDVEKALERKLMDKFIKKPWIYEDLKGALLESIM